jgi:hypothetical protein
MPSITFVLQIVVPLVWAHVILASIIALVHMNQWSTPFLHCRFQNAKSSQLIGHLGMETIITSIFPHHFKALNAILLILNLDFVAKR